MSTSSQGHGRPRSTANRSRPRKRSETAEIVIRLLDDAQAAWQRAELECEDLLQAWYDAPPRTAAERYISYQAALDREAAAARDLERLWKLVRLGEDAISAANGLTRCRKTYQWEG